MAEQARLNFLMACKICLQGTKNGERKEMQKKRAILLLGLLIILIGWWFIVRNGSAAQPDEGFLDGWAMWGEVSDHRGAFPDPYGQSGGVPVRITTQAETMICWHRFPLPREKVSYTDIPSHAAT